MVLQALSLPHHHHFLFQGCSAPSARRASIHLSTGELDPCNMGLF
uniref:Uncharacterized protein n=1 Tax=Setaria viridis TaxID=4556 RepID=A0A4U6VK35_SETVI|nr:hypothetical protein SEVIR_2G006950v2 [Setaria viridis]